MRVGRVSVRGNSYTDSARVLRTFEIPSGSEYTDEAVRRGIRKLYALGLFDDIHVEQVDRGDGVRDLVVHVKERPRIAKIEFAGNQKRETSELEKKLFLRAGETYSATSVSSQVDSLLQYYRDEGFAQAQIEAVRDTTDGGIAIRFQVAEGQKVRIERVEFTGATAFPDAKLRKKMKTKAHGFLGGGEIKSENETEDREKLEMWYRSRGYRDMRYVGQTLKPGSRPDRLVLSVEVDEGPRYRLGDVRWEGNKIVSSADLQKMWPKAKNDLYDLSRIEKAQGLAYAEYAERGYLYLSVEPRETVRDSVVDLTYAITEGQPSHVRFIEIKGNKGTREKVIRREIAIHEGDLFRRSALMRSRDDIMRLGIFEEAMPDFTPADSTDVDLVFKIKEKQVGTASAGAGYTEQAGLTGFLDLGHNNVLGNGQALQLHLERGSKREDYSLSFTEPWFRDTPTLLGFSLFNSQRDLDLYEEKRVGASGRIGRPLPWPDYSRGSISYRIEDVTITSLGATLSAADSAVLAGVRVGDAVRTSSLEINFLRNSTDNPFYPTKGTRLTWNTELAGGPFGGSVNFHKHRVEGRIYLPSVRKSLTTMIRARFGMVGEYADQNRSVPPYERFRLGGGTTVDPLRGYDDYQVVPSKYIRDVVVGYDTTSTGPDSGKVTPLTVKVRYPGGRFLSLLTIEQQFPIVHPLHGVLFFDAGNTWDRWGEIRPFDLRKSVGAGLRMEIPLLGNIGFDYGYGFDRDDGPKAMGHFLIGNVSF